MKQFKRIYIEITNCCNLQCSFCPPTKRPAAFMSVDDFKLVIKKIKGHGSYIYLHLKGEPLLHPEFDQILDVCEENNLKVTLTTNGTLLYDQREVIIKHRCIRQISLSLQSYEGVLGSRAWYKYFNEILEVVKQLQLTSNIISELRLWNYEDEASIGDGAQNNLALSIIEERLGLEEPIYSQLQKGKGLKLADRVYLSRSYEFDWPDMNLPIISEVGTCYGLRQQIGILVNGDVVPCCLDSEGDMVLGNVFKVDFEEIVTSKRAQLMVAAFEKREIREALCKRCGYRKRFDK